MIKITIYLLLFSLTVINSHGQQENGASSFKLPTMLPASPEASAINKGAALSVGMFTGAANARIPLGEIKMSGLSLPIDLNYSGNGLKIDEIPGRTGLGWNLSTGGVVSRIVHDLPDDISQRLVMPPYFPEPDAATLEVLKKKVITSSIYDTEPDEFRVDAPGLSLKFILNDNGTPVIVPHGNEKIQVIKGGGNGIYGGEFQEFIITNTNGVKYKFGGIDMHGTDVIEVTKSRTNTGGPAMPNRIRTAFFLTEIRALNNDRVNFFYTKIETLNRLGVSCSLRNSLYQNTNISMNGYCLPCESPGFTYNEVMNVVTYETVFLKRIETSNYQNLMFTYENRPDNFGDKRIKTIAISNPGNSKTYYLNYDDPLCGYFGGFNNGDVNKRFFLKDVTTFLTNTEIDANGDPITLNVDTLKFAIDYYDNTALPQRLSYSQDHLGFNNGINNQNLLPENYVFPATAFAMANREYNGSEAVKGMLKKITMPTGGYEEFEYEPNKNSKYELVNSTAMVNFNGQGNTVNSIPEEMVYYSPSINILRPQTVNINYVRGYITDCGGGYPEYDCLPFNNANTVISKLQILKGSTVVYSRIDKSYGTLNFTLPLTVGNYTIKLTVNGIVNTANVNLTYDTASVDRYVWSDFEIGGVRVKKITTFEPVTSRFTNKHFKYNKLAATSNNLASYIVVPDYKASIRIEGFCENDNNFQGTYTTFSYSTSEFQCHYEDFNSSSTPLIYTYNGSHVAYPHVIESDHSNFLNGGVQYNFAIETFVNGLNLNGAIQQYLPTNTVTTLTGLELGSKIFNKNFQIQKETLNHYNISYVVNESVNATRFEILYNSPHLVSTPTAWAQIFNSMNIGRYVHQSNWIQKDSSVTIDFDLANNTSLKTKQIFGYGSPNNVQPISITSKNSKGDIVTLVTKYPTDFPATQPYEKMISRNLITPVVETESFTNNVSTGKIRNEFFDWHPGSIFDPTIIEPKRVLAKRGNNPEESRIQYYAYDKKGHPLEVSKEGGAKVSYLWGYDNNFPIAEIKNASLLTDSLAYTSFESDEKGYWVFDGFREASVTPPPTGMYFYNLNNGAISRTLNFTKNYFLTYWLKDGSGTVNVNSTSNKILISRNGWTCYEHKISNNTNAVIYITGTGSIDELRLYPEESFMTTMTHKPFVGITSRNEANNQIVYYEYDASARLIRIRDMDRNIVKQVDYQYKKQIEPCFNVTPNWYPTGITKCLQGGANNNFNGVQLQEEIDKNNCSPTYLHTKWVSVGISSNCTPIAACTEPYKRVIVVGGVTTCETASQIFVSSTQQGQNAWQCVYKYVWSDGFTSPPFIINSTINCGIIGVN